MADGRINNGGARRGSGRKTKAVEAGLAQLLDECVPIEERRDLILGLLQDAKHSNTRVRLAARDTLLAYLFGKPIQRNENDGSIDLRIIDETGD